MKKNNDACEEAIYRQLYATAKALLASKQDGISEISGSTKLCIDELSCVVSISIKFNE